MLHTGLDFPGGSDVKASVYNTGDLGSLPGLGRSPGEGNGNPLQYSCLENPMDTVHRFTKSWTRLSDFTFFLLGCAAETNPELRGLNLMQKFLVDGLS